MKRTLILGLALILPCSLFAQPPRGAPEQAPATIAREQLRELIRILEEAKLQVRNKNTDQRKLEQLIGDMDRQAQRLKQTLDRLPSTAVAISVISDEDYAKLLKAVRAQSFDDGKLAALRDAVKYKHFKCVQAAELVKQFSFSDGQKAAAIALHPKLVDPINFNEVLASLTYDTDKTAVRKALGMTK